MQEASNIIMIAPITRSRARRSAVPRPEDMLSFNDNGSGTMPFEVRQVEMENVPLGPLHFLKVLYI